MPESSIPELKSASQITAELQGESPEQDESEDPKAGKVYSFSFKHKDPRGKVWIGKFTNTILSVKQRRLMKITKAQLSGGVPMSSLDADIWELNEMIAHLSISLDRYASGYPEWALDLEELYDEQIIIQLYAEVASHEATFHRRGEVIGGSATVSEDGAR